MNWGTRPVALANGLSKYLRRAGESGHVVDQLIEERSVELSKHFLWPVLKPLLLRRVPLPPGGADVRPHCRPAGMGHHGVPERTAVAGGHRKRHRATAEARQFRPGSDPPDRHSGWDRRFRRPQGSASRHGHIRQSRRVACGTGPARHDHPGRMASGREKPCQEPRYARGNGAGVSRAAGRGSLSRRPHRILERGRPHREAMAELGRGADPALRCPGRSGEHLGPQFRPVLSACRNTRRNCATSRSSTSS